MGKRVQIDCSKGGRVKPSFKQDTDVNEIMRKYQRTGTIEHITQKTPMYGDFSQIVDYKTATDTVIQAKNAFMELPADLRASFTHDPQELLIYLEQGGDIEERLDSIRADTRPETPEPPAEPPAKHVPTPPNQAPEAEPESPIQGGE